MSYMSYVYEVIERRISKEGGKHETNKIKKHKSPLQQEEPRIYIYVEGEREGKKNTSRLCSKKSLAYIYI